MPLDCLSIFTIYLLILEFIHIAFSTVYLYIWLLELFSLKHVCFNPIKYLYYVVVLLNDINLKLNIYSIMEK